MQLSWRAGGAPQEPLVAAGSKQIATELLLPLLAQQLQGRSEGGARPAGELLLSRGHSAPSASSEAISTEQWTAVLMATGGLCMGLHGTAWASIGNSPGQPVIEEVHSMPQLQMHCLVQSK